MLASSSNVLWFNVLPCLLASVGVAATLLLTLFACARLRGAAKAEKRESPPGFTYRLVSLRVQRPGRRRSRALPRGRTRRRHPRRPRRARRQRRAATHRPPRRPRNCPRSTTSRWRPCRRRRKQSRWATQLGMASSCLALPDCRKSSPAYATTARFTSCPRTLWWNRKSQIDESSKSDVSPFVNYSSLSGKALR